MREKKSGEQSQLNGCIRNQSPLIIFSRKPVDPLMAFAMPAYSQIWQKEMCWVHKMGVEYLCSPRDVEVSELHLTNATEWW